MSVDTSGSLAERFGRLVAQAEAVARGSNVETQLLSVVVQMQYLARQVEDMETLQLALRAS
eukprot:1942946-Prymnesium_polylepis.1